jgi:predicted SprT family Zn-dependent metalloprotease
MDKLKTHTSTGTISPILDNKVLVQVNDKICRTIENHNKTATIQNIEAFQNAFEYYNAVLFDASLPSCHLSFGRKRKALGVFYDGLWQKGENQLSEISLNPDYLSRKPIDVFSTLVHEMAHLWQAVFGKPGKGNYHNKQFSKKMEELGLITSKTGCPGGDRTGQPMSHYIQDGGLYAQAFQAMPKEFLFPWIDKNNLWELSTRQGEKALSKRAIKQRKATYYCSECQSKVWGKPKLKIICGACMKPMPRILDFSI